MAGRKGLPRCDLVKGLWSAGLSVLLLCYTLPSSSRGHPDLGLCTRARQATCCLTTAFILGPNSFVTSGNFFFLHWHHFIEVTKGEITFFLEGKGYKELLPLVHLLWDEIIGSVKVGHLCVGFYDDKYHRHSFLCVSEFWRHSQYHSVQAQEAGAESPEGHMAMPEDHSSVIHVLKGIKRDVGVLVSSCLVITAENCGYVWFPDSHQIPTAVKMAQVQSCRVI